MEKHKIIVAYDFQELSNAALKYAYELAKFVSSGITLVLVISDDFVALAGEPPKKVTEALKKDIEVRLKDVCEKASAEAGVDVNFRVETGKIYEPILSIAKENRARFIVMGRTAKVDGTGNLGSTTMRVVERATCPVISLPSVECCFALSNIAMPIDLTKQTREKVFNAISFGLFFDTTIHLVSVVMGGISERKSRIYQKMQTMKKTIEENGVKCTEKLFKKSHLAIPEVILEYADDINADAIMVMTHREINSSDTYIGAVANQIIKEAKIPVISLTSAAAMHKASEKTTYWFSKLFGG